MISSLEKLRKDYKLYRKKDQKIAARIDILLSYSKFELKYQGIDTGTMQGERECFRLDGKPCKIARVGIQYTW